MAQFVGRTAECAALERYAAQARSGSPRVVVLEGDVGTGKSTLLAHFTAGLDDALTLRASGDEGEHLLAYGVVRQLAETRKLPSAPAPGIPALREDGDPVSAGAELLTLLGVLQRSRRLLVLGIDDLHWADRPSAQALLFALRRLRGDRVLALLSARPGELGRLGEGWMRFTAGDDRVARLRLGGFSPAELVDLGLSLGAGRLSGRVARHLVEYTGGNPLHCRALIEEVGAEGLDRRQQDLRVPQAISGLIRQRVAVLSPAARSLLGAVAVLGGRCTLAQAADLAEVPEPLHALDAAAAAGLLTEEHRPAGGKIAFAHEIIRRVVYGSLSPSRRHDLHSRAVNLVGFLEGLRHRAAASTGPDEWLAADLERAAESARRGGRAEQAAAWLTHASELSPEVADRDRRLLDAVAVLAGCGDAAAARALLPQLLGAAPSSRRTCLLGHLDLLAGQVACAESRLLEAWKQSDPDCDVFTRIWAASHLAQSYLVSGRMEESVEWAERYVDAAATAGETERSRSYGLLAFVTVAAGRSEEGLARVAFLPEVPADVPPAETDVLTLRGVARLLSEQLPGAVSDLTAAAGRLRAGVPVLFGPQCLSYLADAEYRIGRWDDAVIHGELAVSLCHDTEGVWGFGFVHAAAALVPAARGEWEVAADHVDAACESALATGAGAAIATAATARASLAAARGDHEDVLRAAAMVRSGGRGDAFSRPGHFDWPALEIDAYICLEQFDRADRALARLDRGLSPASPPSARVAAARLRGKLAVARGDAATAAESFGRAWQAARELTLPLHMAWLEMDDGRRLRHGGQRPAAVARLRSARERLVSLGARPYVQACDRELVLCGATMEHGAGPGALGLTPAELAVARLVAQGHTNRETAAELYVSVKAVEFHLGHIYAKLGIRNRRSLADRMALPRG